MAEAGVLAVTGSTALQAVEDHGRVRPGDQVLVLLTDGSGSIDLPFVMPPGAPYGTEIWLQYAIQDPAAIAGNAVSA